MSVDALEVHYGPLIEHIFGNSNRFSPESYPEIHTIAHEQRVLTSEQRVRGIANGHIANPSHRPKYGDEFAYAIQRQELYNYDRIARGAQAGYFKGEGPGERLYKTGILRGWRQFDGVVYDLLMYKRYRAVDESTFEKVELIVSYPALLGKLGCEA